MNFFLPKSLFGWILVLPLFIGTAFSQTDPFKSVESYDLPRLLPRSPEHSLDSLQVQPGFRVELAASEPQVVDPVAMAFDELGNLYVVEMRGYSERRDDRLGRIRLLRDEDQDGFYESSVIFADGLAWPTGIACWDGGVFVIETPNLLYFKDTDQDGKSDLRKLIATGFGSTATRLNMQGLPNNLRWTLDNEFHGAGGTNGGMIQVTSDPQAEPLRLNRQDFRLDPFHGSLILSEGGGQHGLAFDDFGDKYVCSNSHHIQYCLDYRIIREQSARGTPPRHLLDIAMDGASAEVFRTSPDEPWRIIRTHWRAAGLEEGPVEGGGRPSGYFTAATGIDIYRGNAFGEGFKGSAFIADAGSNLVHHKMIDRSGIIPKAHRPIPDEESEFLRSSDNWFRPVQCLNGPDGNLYVLDMYREVIEHPWSLPPEIKKYLDLNSGNDRGRIYRIVPEKRQRQTLDYPGNLEKESWVALLRHANAWHRETAARLIFHSRDESLIPALRDLVKESEMSVGRIHGLYALRGLNGLKPDDLIAPLRDSDPRVRSHAVRLCYAFLDQMETHPALMKAFLEIQSDEDPKVRYRYSIVLRGLFDIMKNEPLKKEAIRKLVESSDWYSDDPYLRFAALYPLTSAPGVSMQALKIVLAEIERGRMPETFWQGVKELGRALLSADSETSESNIRQVVQQFGNSPDAVRFLVEISGNSRGKSPMPWLSTDEWVPLRNHSMGVLEDSEQALALQLYAFRYLSLVREPVSIVAAQGILTSDIDSIFIDDIVSVLFRSWESSKVLRLLLSNSEASSIIRERLFPRMVSRSSQARILLSWIEGEKFERSWISDDLIRSMTLHPDSEIRSESREILGIDPDQDSSPEALLAKYSPAIGSHGDPDVGRTIHETRCATCHRLRGAGFQVGPDLESVVAGGRETILLNIINPDREVNPIYMGHTVTDASDETFTGIVTAINAEVFTLRQASALDQVFHFDEIKSLEKHTQSFMPQGLLQGLSIEEVSGLLDYITGSGPSSAKN
ncbi:MAG TPA: hypothetical protein EYQ50_28640 [Verrucomicrobiales bacterium]|nr:hypothetical protein [Verrucomicrobiales bacterium]